MSRSEEIASYLDDHLNEHVEKIQRLVRQPSESTTGTGVPEYAALLAETYLEFGCKDARVADAGDGAPGVWGFYDAGSDLTLACYSYFDTYGVLEEAWSYPPYAATRTPIDGFPSAIVGRGATVKGPARAWLNALEAIIAVEGNLPVNVLFLSEGAEMLGSPNFAHICEDAGEYVDRVNAFLSLRAAEQTSSREVTVNLGFKGMVTFDLKASSGAWGRGPAAGSTTYGNAKSVVDSPTHRLVKALASLLGPDENEIAIEGLSHLDADGVDVSPAEEELISGLISRFAGRPWNTVLPVTGGVDVWARGLGGERLLREYLYGPSINIADLHTSAEREPVKLTMLLPDEATASVELRLVTDIRATEVIAKVREHLDKSGFADVELIPSGVWDGFRQAPDDPIVQATVDTLVAYGREPVLWPIQPFGGPWAGTPELLGVPAITGCALGYGANGGGLADEFYVIESNGTVAGLVESERFCADVLLTYVELVNR